MCNCTGNTSLCSRCSKGLSCGCPPDYSVMPLPVPCGCCPPGYTFKAATPNWPNGYCQAPVNSVPPIAPIPCTPCEVSVPSDCVFLPAISCFGIPVNTTLTSFISNYLCSDAFMMNLLQRVGLSVDLKAAFCEITSVCPVIGSTTPIWGPITVTVP